MARRLMAAGCLVVAVGIGVGVLVLRQGLMKEPHHPAYDRLMAAIRTKDASKIVDALKEGSDANYFPNDAASILHGQDYAPLSMAASLGDLDSVKALLDHGANPNVGDGWNGDALTAAAKIDAVPILQLLVDRGAKVNDQKGGSFPLWEAAMAGKEKAVEFLLKQGANPNSTVELDDQNGDETVLKVVKRDHPNDAIANLLKNAGGHE